MGLALHHQGPTFKQLHTIWPVCFAAYDKYMKCIISFTFVLECFAAYDKHMKCIISFRFVLESQSKVLSGELYVQG